MKKIYLKLTLIKPKVKRIYNNKMKDYNSDFIRIFTREIYLRKFII